MYNMLFLNNVSPDLWEAGGEVGPTIEKLPCGKQGAGGLADRRKRS